MDTGENKYGLLAVMPPCVARRRLGLLAAVLGSGDIHLLPVPHPTALDPARLPCDAEVRASTCCLAADLFLLLSALDIVGHCARFDHAQDCRPAD